VQLQLLVALKEASADSIADAPKLLGTHDRQCPQHHLLHQRENRRGRPDAESK
jgi:hypothetical protein